MRDANSPNPSPNSASGSGDPHAGADCNLLFGLIALQVNFVTREALVAAFDAWTQDKARPLSGESELRDVCQLEKHGDNLQWRSNLHVTVDGSTVIHVGDVEICIWDLPSGKVVSRVPVKLSSFPGASAVSRDGRTIAVSSGFEVAHVKAVSSGKTLASVSKVGRTIFRSHEMPLSRQGTHVVIPQDSAAQVHDLVNHVEAFTSPSSWRSIAAIADGGRRVALTDGSSVRIYDPVGKREIAVIDASAEVADLAFDSLGHVLVTISKNDRSARMWATDTGTPLASFDTGQREPVRVTLSPSGRWMATGDSEGMVRIWDLGEYRRRLVEAELDWPAPPITQPPETSQDSVTALLYDARRHYLFGRYRDAVVAYSNALELDAEEASILWERGESYRRMNRHAQAIEDFEQATRLAPENSSVVSSHVEAVAESGVAHAERGEWEDAVRMFRRSLALNSQSDSQQSPTNAILHLSVGDVAAYRQICLGMCERLGSGEDDEPQIIRACTFGPGAIPELFRTTTESAGTMTDAQLSEMMQYREHASTLGALCFRAGRLDDAIRILRRAVSLRGREVIRESLVLAMAYRQQNNVDEARHWLIKAEESITQASKSEDDAPSKYDELRWIERLDVQLLWREARAMIGP